jgi:hypothetical protein
MNSPTTHKWHRFDDQRGVGYRTDGAEIYDNGGGLGPSRGSGRWAVEVGGKWIANVDTLAEAKATAFGMEVAS